MVKASKYTTLAVAALLLSAACTQQEPGSTYRDDPDAVRISAQVGNGEGSPATRSTPVGVLGKEESFKTGDRVCVTADGQPAVVYAYDGSSWTPQEDKFLKWNPGNGSIIDSNGKELLRLDKFSRYGYFEGFGIAGVNTEGGLDYVTFLTDDGKPRPGATFYRVGGMGVLNINTDYPAALNAPNTLPETD